MIVIASGDLNGSTIEVLKDEFEDNYHVKVGDKFVQPNHAADGAIRYLIHVIHSLNYKVEKLEGAVKANSS